MLVLLEQRVQGNAETVADRHQRFEIGIGFFVFPIRHRLARDVKNLTEGFLGHAVVFSDLCDFFSEFHGSVLSFMEDDAHRFSMALLSQERGKK